MADAAQHAGKRVSWVELYLDLVFVLAVGQLAHLIVAEPRMRSVWIALGLFVVLWWTWIGFTVIYNRLGEDEPRQRLVYLAGSVPVGVAAVAIDPASLGDSTVFALSLAVTRLVLTAAEVLDGDFRGALDRRITRAFLTSVVLFTVSIWVPEPWRYVLWAIAIGAESGALLTDDRDSKRTRRREMDLATFTPTDPAERLDAHHFAERFGLFLIILLGEVVISAGQASVDGHVDSVAGWAALVAAMVLAAALWWLYFDAAAEINLKVLQLSGGSPVIARTIFAAGHMLPAFALIITAAGVGLLLEGEPPQFAYWLPAVGLGMYLVGTRVTLVAASLMGGAVRIVVLLVTFGLGRLGQELSAREYLWLLTVWAIGCAALATLGSRRSERSAALGG